MSNSNFWPSMVDYQEAVQIPTLAFASPDLRNATAVENQLGLPRPTCGTFASVYELANGGQCWAAKCFLRNIPDLHQRYSKISDHLRSCQGLEYFVAFDYLEEGILVKGKQFPLVKMEWVEGCQLDVFVEQNLSNSEALIDLKKRWGKLLVDLRSNDIAHGDLQHGNILVLSNSDLRLIDYDGMWVPTLDGELSNETGHPNYQNPHRTQTDFHAEIDDFAGTVIEITISALAQKEALWDTYHNGDNLLFRRQDFLDPRGSNLMEDLFSLGDSEIVDKLEMLIHACIGTERTPRDASASGEQRPCPSHHHNTSLLFVRGYLSKTLTPTGSTGFNRHFNCT